MSNLRSTVADVSKNKRLTGTVIEVLANLVTVTLGTEQRILKGLRYIGGPLEVGATVFIDYASGTPMVSAQGNNPVTITARPMRPRSSVVDPDTSTGLGAVGITGSVVVSTPDGNKTLNFVNGLYVGYT
jgi:hypothetical protein